MRKIPVIMDVDTGIDDAFSILLASSLDSIDLLGISTVAGNVPIRDSYRNTCYVRHLLGLDFPVAKGSGKAFVRRAHYGRRIHGAHGLGLIEDVPDFTDRKPLDVFDFYGRALEGCDEPVTIIANGPLTNIAALLLGCPGLKQRIARIVFMGGAVLYGNVTAAAEFNVWKDPEAAQVVLNSGVPLVMAGLEVTRTATVAVDDVEEFRSRGNATQKLFASLLEYYLERCVRRANSRGAPLHDSVTVAWVADPSMFSGSEYFVSVDTSEGPGRGATIVDKFKTLRRTPNVHMLEGMDTGKFLAMTKASVAGASLR